MLVLGTRESYGLDTAAVMTMGKLYSAVLQVANLNVKDGTFTLKDFAYKDIQRDWPGYSDGDQQLLKRVLVR